MGTAASTLGYTNDY
ncbi:Uncharacterized protein APZ42_026284 [Daphnia magna]|uniref:Uncharacterized protein n=1 Tax=Daphnia magna TaxID=35525 RepID=A0A162DB69_9CRUS|nr:Uncharacterized protein APZ42_026284 [Daphnia magna]